MRSFILGASLLVFGCTNDPNPPTEPPTSMSLCTPESEGFGGLTSLQQPAFSLPPGCRILEDDGRTAIFRRQVTVIDDADELQAACAGPATDGGVAAFDGGMDAPAIDFATSSLLVIRIPDTALPRWSVVASDGKITIAESSAICTGIDPKPRRYLRLIPRSSTVAFHLCAPEGCDEDPG